MTKLAGLTQMTVLNQLVKASDEGVHCLTLDELADMIQHPRRIIVKRMQALMGNGYARTVRIGCYAVTPQGYKRQMDGGDMVSGPRKGVTGRAQPIHNATLRARVWRAFRVNPQSTKAGLLQLASRPEDDGKTTSAIKLINQLCRAGYAIKMPLRIKPTRQCSGGEVIYYLVKNTGPKCPIERLIKPTGVRGLYDHNTEEFTPYGQPQARPKAVRASA